MRRIHVSKITGDEVLANNVYVGKNSILLTAGIRIKKSYKDKLIELGIEYLYVKDSFSAEVDTHDLLDIETKEITIIEFKNILEKYISQSKLNLDEIKSQAIKIIHEVISQKNILINISDIRKKDEVIYSHSINVCSLSVLMALKLGYNQSRVRDIAIGALLHDIGKVLLPKELLISDKEYSEVELQEIKKHVIYGFEAVKNEVWLNPISKVIILTHHEAIDNSGYPFGWSGDKIHDASKIVAICNEFDNLTINKRKKIKIYEAIEYITSESNKKFDESMIKIFKKSVAMYPSGTGIITNDGSKAIVLRQNNDFPDRPVIRIIEKNNKKVDEWIEIDLTESLTTFIVDSIEI